MGCIFPWTDDVDVCPQGLRALAPSQPVFSFSAPRAGGACIGFVDTVDQLQVFSLHFSPPSFFFFSPPSDSRAITLGSRIFSAEQSLSRFSLTEKGCGRGKVLFVAVCPAHPPPRKLFLISPAKRSANAAQACPTTLAVVSALRNTLCQSGQEMLLQSWSEAFFFFSFFAPKFLRGHRQCFVERRGTTTGVFLHQALYTVLPFLALSLLVYEGLRHFFPPFFSSLSPRH